MMKINELAVYRFGRFQNKKITLPQTPLVMIYGENESGKSTLTAFLLSQMFGFPAKKELEKWGGAAPLGGHLDFTADDGRTYRLKRTLNGREEEEQLTVAEGVSADWAAFLNGMNRALYEQVFCFNADGLRSIEKMGPEDLNDLLLGAGMIGSGKIGELEAALEKHAVSLFKKNGRNPQINRLLKDVNDCSLELKAWEKKSDSYLRLQDQIRAGEQRVAELERKIREAERAYHEWMEVHAALPLIRSYRALELEIQADGSETVFPQDGRERFEDAKKVVATLRRELEEADEHMKRLDEAMRLIHADDRWKQQEPVIQRLFRELSVDEQARREIRQMAEAIEQKRGRCRRICDLLGENWTPERIRRASSDLAVQEQLKEKLDTWQERREQRREVARDLKAALDKIEDLEQQTAQASMRLDGTRENSRPEHSSRWTSIHMQIIYVAALTMTFAAVSAIAFAPPAAVPPLILGAVMAALVARDGRGKNSHRFTHDSGRADRDTAEHVLLTHQRKAAEEEVRRLKEKQTACTRACDELEEKIKEWLQTCGMPLDDLSGSQEKVRLIQEAQALIHEVDELSGRHAKLNEHHRRFIEQVHDVAVKVGVPEADVAYLDQHCREEMERMREKEDMEKQKLMYQKQKERYMARISSAEHIQMTLLAAVQAKDEEQFYAAADRHERRYAAEKQREAVRLQLLELAGSPQRLDSYLSYADTQVQETPAGQNLKNDIAEYESELKQARDKLANERASARNMENDALYRDVLDRYHALLSSVRHEAMEWAAYQTAIRAIRQAKADYRQQRLPRVLTAAARYFRFVTGNRYRSVHLEAEGFVAERADGRIFRAIELSRGTAEQLYLSLRLALMHTFTGYEKLPLIVDDGFVNFDRERSDYVYALLEKVAEERQVMILTCHENAYLHAHPEAVITLSGNQDAGAVSADRAE